MLAMNAGPVPQQVGAVLLLEAGPGFDLAAAQRLLADRVSGVPRLRQRLGCVGFLQGFRCLSKKATMRRRASWAEGSW
jgi:hypothetical protein